MYAQKEASGVVVLRIGGKDNSRSPAIVGYYNILHSQLWTLFQLVSIKS